MTTATAAVAIVLRPLTIAVPPLTAALAATAVGLALTAVLLGLAGPADTVRRLRRLRAPAASGAVPAEEGLGSRGRSGGLGRLLGLLGPRPDALPLRGRLALAAVTGIGIWGLLSLGGALDRNHRPVFGLGAGLICLVVAGRLEPAAARRRRLRVVVDLPHLLDLLAAALKAGLPLRVAVAKVAPLIGGPLGADLDQVLRQVDLGVPEAVAWRTLCDHPALGRLALDLARSVDSGLMLAATLAHHASDARRTRRGTLEARARSVGVHSVPPLMVCFLPAFLLIGVVPTGVSAFLHALG